MCKNKQCCCNCKYQLELFKHPFNKIHKGSIMDSTGLFACTFLVSEAIIFENKHGICEGYIKK